MPEAHDSLLTVQAAAVALLEGAAYFSGVSILAETKGDLATQIDTAVAQMSLCVLVMTPGASAWKRSGDKMLLTVPLVVDVTETPLTNSSCKSALAAAAAALLALRWKPNGLDPAGARHMPGLHEFSPAKDDPIRAVPPEDGRVAYQVHLTTEILL